MTAYQITRSRPQYCERCGAENTEWHWFDTSGDPNADSDTTVVCAECAEEIE